MEGIQSSLTPPEDVSIYVTSESGFLEWAFLAVKPEHVTDLLLCKRNKAQFVFHSSKFDIFRPGGDFEAWEEVKGIFEVYVSVSF